MSHYYSRKPITSGKTTIIYTRQFGVNFTFKSQSGVFNWQKIDTGSELLLNSVILPKKKKSKILDLGCGFGFLGVVLAKIHPKLDFSLVDINELAVKLTKENCKQNEVTANTNVFQGHLYEPIKDEIFDVIITNPPLMAGKKILDEIVSKSVEHLNPKGSLQLVVPKKKGLKSMQKSLEATFGSYEVLAKGSGFWILQGING